MSRFCTECGHKNSDTANFCGGCGKRVAAPKKENNEIETGLQSRSLAIKMDNLSGEFKGWLEKAAEDEYAITESTNNHAPTWDLYGKHLAAHQINKRKKKLVKDLIEMRDNAVRKYGQQKLDQVLAEDAQIFDAKLAVGLQQELKRQGLIADVHLYGEAVKELGKVFSSSEFDDLDSDVKAMLIEKLLNEVIGRLFVRSLPPDTEINADYKVVK